MVMIYKKLCCAFRKKIILVLILFTTGYAFAQNTDWTIGAAKFRYTQDLKRSEYENSVLLSIPKLILEQLYGIKSRTIPDREVLDRKLDTLVKERLSLFLELSKEEKLKDSLVLKSMSKYQFDKQTAECEKKIIEIKKKIDLNLEAQDKVFKNFYEDKEEFDDRKQTTEEFKMYKSDTNTLFEFSDEKIDYMSYQASLEVTEAKIDGLITGSIITYGSYAAVTAELILYPGNTSVGVVTEVGLLTDVGQIAKNIAYRLFPLVENAIPCEVEIKIVPESLRKSAKLTVDSTVYEKIPSKIIVSTGVHNFTFECEGKRKEYFSYGFGYEKKYIIEVEFVTEDPAKTALSLKKIIPGNIFYNGKEAEDNVMSVRINNRGVLGFYYTENENTIFFMVPPQQLEDKKVVVANIKDYDVGENIEKRRRMMYISYSTLICSLPFLFYSYSNFNNYARGYALGSTNIDIEKIRLFQTMSYIGIGLTTACGVWFITELVLYLISANKALPVETKASKIDFDQSVVDFKNVQEEYQKKLEEEKKKEEELKKEAQKNEEQKKESQNEDQKQNKNENSEAGDTNG